MLDDRDYMRPKGAIRLPMPWTFRLLLILVGVYFVQLVTGEDGVVNRYFALSPQDPFYFWAWQLFTFQFLHAGLFHLLCNAIGLYFFGRALEIDLGARTFLKLYLFSGVLGGLAHLALGFLFPTHFGIMVDRMIYLPGVVGASAGVCGLVGAFGVMYSERVIQLLIFFVIPVSMKAKFLAWGLGVLAILGMLEQGSNVGHAAHLGGLLGGVIFVKFFLNTHFEVDWSQMARRKTKPPLTVLPSPVETLSKGGVMETGEGKLGRSVDFMAQEVDPILDKISAHGIHSLTDQERKILEAARSKMKRP